MVGDATNAARSTPLALDDDSTSASLTSTSDSQGPPSGETSVADSSASRGNRRGAVFVIFATSVSLRRARVMLVVTVDVLRERDRLRGFGIVMRPQYMEEDRSVKQEASTPRPLGPCTALRLMISPGFYNVFRPRNING